MAAREPRRLTGVRLVLGVLLAFTVAAASPVGIGRGLFGPAGDGVSTAVHAYYQIAPDPLLRTVARASRTIGERGRLAKLSTVKSATLDSFAPVVGAESGLATAPDQAVFWSEIRGGDETAATWAAKNGGTTLEMTPGGSSLPAWDASNPSVVSAWRQASAEFTSGASGNVTVLQDTAVRVNSVWAEVEYPALTANPSVTSITAINPGTGDSTLLWSRP